MFIDEDEDEDDESDYSDEDDNLDVKKFEKLLSRESSKNQKSAGRRGGGAAADNDDDNIEDAVLNDEDSLVYGEEGEFTYEAIKKHLASLSKFAGLICRINPNEASEAISAIVKKLRKDFASEDDEDDYRVTFALMTLVEIFTHLPSKNIPNAALELASKFYELSSKESLEVKAVCILGFGVFAQLDPDIFQEVASKCVTRIYETIKQLKTENTDLAAHQLLTQNICLSIAKILYASKTHIPSQFIPNWLDSIPTSNDPKQTKEQVEEFIKILTEQRAP